MIIGIPRERKKLEKRVALTPQNAEKLISQGHKILIEKSAGLGSHFADAEYKAVGCSICKTLAEVWSADMIVKVKEPDIEEFQYFREGQVLFDYLHLAGLPNVAKELVDAKVTGIAYELVQLADRSLPLLEPMSEIAGKLAVQNGAHYLLTQHGGRGVLLGGTRTVSPGTVTIIGAGIAGRAACRVAVGIGANVNVLDINENVLNSISREYADKVRTLKSSADIIDKLAAETDLMILAVLVPGDKAPRVLSAEQVKRMPAGSVLIDISIDQGGAAETIKPTSLAVPVYTEHNVIHYGVPNMPSQAARTATKALTAATFPYIEKLANLGFEQAVETIPELKLALNTHAGKIVNPVVAKALGNWESES